MSFQWPALLWGLLLIPLMAGLYVWLLRRRSRLSVSFPMLDIVAIAVDTRHRIIRRHLPAAFFLLTVLAIATALARPVISLPVPSDRTTMMLAIDVSGSMLSQDVDPSRLEAAKAAAKTFVTTLPSTLRIGLVTFAGYAVLVVPPTAEHQRVLEAIDAITVRHRTAIGDGLLEAVAALPERVRPLPDGTLPPMRPDLPPGTVVLLSDGQNNAGTDPLVAADIAHRERVTVYTVGIGVPLTPATRWILGGPLDEETLRAMAVRTGGAYYHPKTGRELRDIYKKLARSAGWERRPVEVTSLAAGAGILALLAAVTLGVGLHPLAR